MEEFPGLKEDNVVGRWNSEVASKVAEGSGTKCDNAVQWLFGPVVWGKMKIVSVMASDVEKQTKFLAKALVHWVPNAGLCCHLVAILRNNTSVQVSRISG